MILRLIFSRGGEMAVSRRDFFKVGGLSITTFGLVKQLASSVLTAAPAKLENMTAGVKPLTAEDYLARIQNAQRLLAENGIDGLFLSGSTDLLYFTNVSWGRSERTFGAVLNRKGNPVWVCPAFEHERAKERIPEGQDVRTWEENESPYRLIAGILKDLGAGSGRLALGPTVRAFVYYGLRADAPALELANGAVVTEGCRGIKTEKEVFFMDLANRITKLAYKEAFGRLRDGMTALELAGIIRDAHNTMGASGGGWPQYGLNSAYPHGSMVPRDLKEGDAVVVDGGCSVEGYRSDVTRTVVLGTPSDKQRHVWDIVKKAQTAAIEAVRPGVACEEIDRVARRVIEEAGFGPGYKYFSHRLGHGIGMDGHEYPYLVKGNALKLRPGMTFSNEPGIYIYGEFGVRIEDCFVVTKDGGRFLGGMEAAAIDIPFSE